MTYWNDEIVDKIRKGYYSAVYFNRTKEILLKEGNKKVVTMQIFQKHKESILCGVEEVVELLKVGTGYWDSEWIDKFSDLKVESLSDGDKISFETVMHITGPYVYFAHLESLYLGILARRSLVATNTRRVVEAAGGKQILFFADRFDHFLNQGGDGYAAGVGGASAVCTGAMAKGFGKEAVGTIPHALIAINDGNTVEAVLQFARYFSPSRSRFATPGRWPNGLSCKELLPGGEEGKIIALVDFDNDCVKTSLEVAKALGKRLWGVRLDTAENIIDVNLKSQISNLKSKRDYYGVNPTLVKMVRKALDQEGFGYVKIVVSGGFNDGKIKWFEREKAPVDVYGVGSALVHGANDFTADVVKVEGKEIAKVGREYRPNSRLRVVKSY